MLLIIPWERGDMSRSMVCRQPVMDMVLVSLAVESSLRRLLGIPPPHPLHPSHWSAVPDELQVGLNEELGVIMYLLDTGS